jgi:phosphoenolpyruvate carboxylase
MIADGRLLDLLRRISAFDLSLLKLDIRQESTRHSEALDAITQYLGLGSYLEWDEEQRLTFLTTELQVSPEVVHAVVSRKAWSPS